MRKFVSILGMLAAVAMLAISGAVNWRFGYALGSSPIDSHLFAAASAASDVFKALAPFFVFAAFAKRHIFKGLASTLLWVVCCAYSLTSAMGFVALNRADTASVRQQQSNTYAAAIMDRDTVAAKMKWIPAHRPVAAVAAEITAWQSSKLFDLSKQCSDQGRALKYCADNAHLKSELASATEAEALQVKLDVINQRIGAAQAVTSADPQVDALAGVVEQVRLVTGYEPATDAELARTTQRVKAVLLVALALLVELGSALGLYVSSAAWPETRNVSRETSEKLHKKPSNPAPVQPVQSLVLAVQPVQTQHVAVLPAPNQPVSIFKKCQLIAAKGRRTLVQNVLQSYNEWAVGNGHPAMHLSQLQKALMQAQVTCEVHDGRLYVAGFALVRQREAAA